MLSSISPVGEAARGQRWGVTVTAYTVGSAVGGAAVGAAAGALGWLLLREVPQPAALLVLAVITAIGLALDLTAHVPTWRRQVDERWLETYRGWAYGFGYGVQLGLGVVTVAAGTLLYAALVAAALTASPLAGALIGLVFGVARALPLLLGATVRTPAALRARLAMVDRWRAPATRASRIGQAAVGAATVLVALQV